MKDTRYATYREALGHDQAQVQHISDVMLRITPGKFDREWFEEASKGRY